MMQRRVMCQVGDIVQITDELAPSPSAAWQRSFRESSGLGPGDGAGGVDGAPSRLGLLGWRRRGVHLDDHATRPPFAA